MGLWAGSRGQGFNQVLKNTQRKKVLKKCYFDEIGMVMKLNGAQFYIETIYTRRQG